MTEKNTILFGNSARHDATQYMRRLVLKVCYSPKLDNLCWKVGMGCALGDV